MYDEYDSVRFLREPPPLPPFFGALADFLEGVWGGGGSGGGEAVVVVVGGGGGGWALRGVRSSSHLSHFEGVFEL